MSFTLNKSEPIDEGIRRLIHSESSEACNFIRQNKQNAPHESIHEVRKSFKKIRAALRLIRDSVDFYNEGNTFYRDQGRRISDIRDATSVVEALDLIYEQHEDRLYKNAFAGIREKLAERRTQHLEQVISSDVLADIQYELERVSDRIMEWEININAFGDIEPSLARVYKRGRKAFESSKETQAPEAFHEWRKRVKYLRYQIDILNRTWPDYHELIEDELHKVSDYLGTDRDLFMLQNLMHEELHDAIEYNELFLLDSLINEHRQQMQQHAIELGYRLYQSKTKQFTEQMKVCWEAYERERAGDLVPSAKLEY